MARLVKGKKVKEGVQLWVQTDTPSYFMAQHYGDTKAIEDAGGKIYHQTCMAMTPFRHYPKNITIATSSFKYVKLCAGFGSEGTTWIYANPEALVNAAVTACSHRPRAGTTGASRGRSGWPARGTSRCMTAPVRWSPSSDRLEMRRAPLGNRGALGV